MFDCIVIGGGPAGLTAAIYLARFHLNIRVIDAGKSRAKWIANTRNHAGYPEGISGPELLAAMSAQAANFNVSLVRGNVTRIEKAEHGFALEYGPKEIRSKTILLATGVTNRKPVIDEALHDQGLQSGHLRYCAVCDGYEVTDKSVAIIGTGKAGLAEAVFLRSYTEHVSLLSPDTAHTLSRSERDEAMSVGITIVDGPTRIKSIKDDEIVVSVNGSDLAFASIYPALGSDVSSALALGLGAKVGEGGCVIVDKHQRTSVPFLYAAGDVVLGLDQISNAMGQAGVAATTVRNDLAKQSPLLR